MMLDAGMLAALAVATPALTWPLGLAVLASLARVVVAGRNLPPLFAPQASAAR